MPKSRKLLAVPFVGKDVPSRASEFSHPDVVVGLTILAYRYEGLRMSDFRANLRALKEEMEEEQSGPYHLRPACRTLVRWVTLAGGTVRGVKHGGGENGFWAPSNVKATGFEHEPVTAACKAHVTKDEQPFCWSVYDPTSHSPNWHGEGWAVPAADEESGVLRGEFENLWPLQLVDLRDEEMVGTLFKLLRRLPQVIDYYLDTLIFPETMEHRGLKLAANGQDVGGNMLFEVKLGFSGTPSDLLPLELGRCQFELGNTAMMVHYLTDPAVTSHRLLGTEWSVTRLLSEVARSTDPPFHALIDGGALVTGMTNLEVARWV
ncbi:unnamed protein product, partial [Ectocarpus sp. 12 AP-2014]